MQQQDGGSAGALPPAARPDSPHSSRALPLRPNWRQTLASPHTCKWFPLHKYRLLKGPLLPNPPSLFFFFLSSSAFFLFFFHCYIPQPGRVKKKKKVGKGGFGMCNLHSRPKSAGNPLLCPHTPGACLAQSWRSAKGVCGLHNPSQRQEPSEGCPSPNGIRSLSSHRPFPVSHASNSPHAQGRF